MENISLHRLRVVNFSSPVSTSERKENVKSICNTELNKRNFKRGENGNKFRGMDKHKKISDAQAGGDSPINTTNDASTNASRSHSKIFSSKKNNKKHISKNILSNKELKKPRKKKNVSLFSLFKPLNFNLKARRNARSQRRAKKKEATNLLISLKTLKMTSSSVGIVKHVDIRKKRRNLIPFDVFCLRKSKKTFRPYLHYRSSHYFDLDCFFLNLKNRRRSLRMKGISIHVKEKPEKTHNVCNYNSIHSVKILSSGSKALKNIQNYQKKIHEQVQPVQRTTSTAWSSPIRRTEQASNTNTKTTQEKEIASILLSPIPPNYKDAACGPRMVMAQNNITKFPQKYKEAACGCSMVMPQNDYEKLPQNYKESACDCSILMSQNNVEKLPQKYKEAACACSIIMPQKDAKQLPKKYKEAAYDCSTIIPQNDVKKLPKKYKEAASSACSIIMPQKNAKQLPQNYKEAACDCCMVMPQNYNEVTCDCSTVMPQTHVKQLPQTNKERIMPQNNVAQSCEYCDPPPSNFCHECESKVSSRMKMKSKSPLKKRAVKTTKRRRASGMCKTCVRHTIVGLFIVVSSPCLLVVFLVWGVLLYPISIAKYYDVPIMKKSNNTDTISNKNTETCECITSFHKYPSPDYSHPVIKKSNSSHKTPPHDFRQPDKKKSSIFDKVVKTCYPPESCHMLSPHYAQPRQTNKSSLLNHWYAHEPGVAAIPYRTVLSALKHRSSRSRRGWEIKRMSFAKGLKGFEVRVPVCTSLSRPSNKSKTLPYNNTLQQNECSHKIINYPCSSLRLPCDKTKMSGYSDTSQKNKSSQKIIHDSCLCIRPCVKSKKSAYCDIKQKNIHNPCRCAQPYNKTKTFGYCDSPLKNESSQNFTLIPCQCGQSRDKIKTSGYCDTQQKNKSSQKLIRDSCPCSHSCDKTRISAYDTLQQNKSSQKFMDDPCSCCFPFYKTKLSDRHRQRQNETLLNITEYEPVQRVAPILPRSSKSRPVLQKYFSRIGAAYAKSKFSLIRPWQAKRLQQSVSRKPYQVKSMFFQKDPTLACYYNNYCNYDYNQSLNAAQLCQACEPQCLDGLCCEPILSGNSRARATFCEMKKVHRNCDYYQSLNAAQQSCQACKPNHEGSFGARARICGVEMTKDSKRKCAQQPCRGCKPIHEGSSGAKATFCECEKTKKKCSHCAQQSYQACKPNSKGTCGARASFCECEETKVSKTKSKRKLRCVLKKACCSLRNSWDDFWNWFNCFQKHLCPEHVSCRHLYIHTLRKRPCFCIHKMCPSLYPHFLNCYRCHVNMFWFCASGFALCFWWPIIFCCTLCLELLCCCIRLVCFI